MLRLAPTRSDEIKRQYVQLPHPTAFGGINRLTKFHNIKQHQAENALSGVNSYTLHREYKKPRKRNPYYIYYRRQQIQLDLIDMHQLARFNANRNYIFVAIDCFSRKVWMEPLKSKSAKETLDVLRGVIRDMVDKPKSIFCDRGTEFKNALVRQYLERENITLMHPSSEVKAGIVERVNRTLQNMIYRYMTENETRTYLPVLQLVADTYNNRPHSSIDNISPNDADKPENSEQVASALRDHYFSLVPKKKVLKFKIGDTVRLKTHHGDRFARGYEEQFSREIYKVVDINTRMAIPMYMLQSTDTGENIEGGCYSNELQLVTSDVFKIEKVIKRRIRRGVREIYVKWLNFGDQHNCWIRESDVTNVYNQENGLENNSNV
jgi:hypothetical protein